MSTDKQPRLCSRSICADCSATGEGKRNTRNTTTVTFHLPSGWKEIGGGVRCQKCAKANFRKRASAIRVSPVSVSDVSGPEADRRTGVDLSWDEFHDRLDGALIQVRLFKNRIVSELMKHDAFPGEDGVLLPYPPLADGQRFDVYKCLITGGGPFAPQWAKTTGTAAKITSAVTTKYLSERFVSLVGGSRAIAEYRDKDCPFAMIPEHWRTESEDGPNWRNGRYLLTFRLPPLDTQMKGLSRQCVERLAERHPGQRYAPSVEFTVCLAGGKGVGRQRADFRRLIAGEVEKTELQVYWQRANKGDHRGGRWRRLPGGREGVYFIPMVKFVFSEPRTTRPDGENTMDLRTGVDHFLAGEVITPHDEETIYPFNDDHIVRGDRAIVAEVRRLGGPSRPDQVRGWIERHRVELERIALDRKFEKRVPRHRRVQQLDRLAQICAKQKNRIETAMKQAIASLAGIARRWRVGMVNYDDRCQDYYVSFPWHAFRVRLQTKLAEHGIAFQHVSPPKSEDAASQTEADPQGGVECRSRKPKRSRNPAPPVAPAAEAPPSPPPPETLLLSPVAKLAERQASASSPVRGPRRSRGKGSPPLAT